MESLSFLFKLATRLRSLVVSFLAHTTPEKEIAFPIWLYASLKTHTPCAHRFEYDDSSHKTGIEGLVWHDLRATFGTRLGEAGFDAFTIAALMGHSDIHTKARYVGATERNKRAAVEAAMLSSKQVVHKLATRPL